MRTSFAQILEIEKQQFEKKRDKKLPNWKGFSINIPSSLSFEQCSSSQTAEYKAFVAQNILFKSGINPTSICDITGGLGVDSFAFASVFDKVHYFEKDAQLMQAAKANASELGINNIDFYCEQIDQNSKLPNCDLIYADPARRSINGNKVFLLEDCSPDILTLIHLMFEKTNALLFKLSPMADLTMLSSRFGKQLSEIHIVSLDGEVKELLCILDKNHKGPYTIKIVQLPIKTFEEVFAFNPEQEKNAQLSFASEITKNHILLEPNSAVLKASCFKLISEKYGIEKLEVNTHLYISDKPLTTNLLKQYQIIDILPFKQISQIKKLYPRAEVSARNIHLKTEELRRRCAVDKGGDIHIFGTKTKQASILIVGKRL